MHYTASRWARPVHRVILIVGTLACAAMPEARAESLRDVVAATLRDNPRVLAAAAQRRAALEDIAQARGARLPSVDVNLGLGPERTSSPQVRAAGTGDADLTRRDAGLLITQRLYDGNAVSSEVERLSARADFSAARLSEVREEVALQATQAYIEVLQHRRLLGLANDNLRAHLETHERVRQRVEGGVGQRSDLQQALGRIALAKSVITARAGRLREAEALFQRVVGRPAPPLEEPAPQPAGLMSAGEVDTARLARSTQERYEAARQTSPTLRAAAAEISAAEAAVRGARSAYRPRLNLELSSNRNYNIAGLPGHYSSDALMLVLRWNLFRGGADSAAERALIERRYAAIDTSASVQRDVQERIALALNAKATSEERLRHLHDHERLSVEVVQAFNLQLELGRRTLLDVLNAENELFGARSNLASAQYEDLFNGYAVEAAQGALVKSLGLPAE